MTKETSSERSQSGQRYVWKAPTIKHLKFLVQHLLRTGGRPLRGRHKGTMTEESYVRQWLYLTKYRLKDAKTTPIRAALVSLGYLEPNGDEWRFWDQLPGFLRDMPRRPIYGTEDDQAVPAMHDETPYGMPTRSIATGGQAPNPQEPSLLRPRHGLFYEDD